MKVDVVILTKCEKNLVFNCIDSLVKFSAQCVNRLIVCYTGSSEYESEKLESALADLPFKTVLTHGIYNFAALNNEMVLKHCDAPGVLFLNDDCELVEDALGPCVDVLDKNPSIGMCGIKLLFPSGKIQHAGVFTAQENGQVYGVGHRWYAQDDRVLPSGLVEGVTGAFMLVRRSLFLNAGGFDTRFHSCFEDVCLCKRVRDLGYGIVCLNSVRAIHHESATRHQDMCREDVELLLQILNNKDRMQKS